MLSSSLVPSSLQVSVTVNQHPVHTSSVNYETTKILETPSLVFSGKQTCLLVKKEVMWQKPEVLPWGQAGFAALAAAGIDARPIIEETAQGQLLPDRLPLILLGLQQEINKIWFNFCDLFFICHYHPFHNEYKGQGQTGRVYVYFPVKTLQQGRCLL